MIDELIPVNEPVIGDKEIEYVTDCLNTGWISSAGDYIELFENEWANYCGREYGVAVSNGSVALEAAMATLNLSPGDEVIIPCFTIISCAHAVTRFGCIPVLVDSDPETWCIDVGQIEQKITTRTKAIMVVHIYGHPVNMDPLLELAERHNLSIIEDAAEAHGAEYLSFHNSNDGQWIKCGNFGDVSAFSFYANKIITTGEGGMVLTDSLEFAEKLRSYRNLAFMSHRRFYHEDYGSNLRLTNLQAAIGYGQVQRVEELVERKKDIAKLYTEGLEGTKGISIPVEKKWAKNVYWMYGLVLSKELGIDALEFSRRLQNYGIQTRPFFLGMHRQPIFWKQGLFIREKYPIADWLADYGFYLPSGLALTNHQIKRVISSVMRVLKEI